MPLLPTPWPADPVEGEPGHFDHTLWVKAGLIALDNGKIDKPAAGVPAGKLLATTATDTWEAVDPTAVGGVPSGVIVMWTGTIPPPGWKICNGQNGTPNLSDKFILSSGTRTPGSSGGEETVLLTGEQSGVAPHTHAMLDANATHSHNVNRNFWNHSHSTTSDGWHNHALDYLQDVALGSPNGKRVTGAGSYNNAGTAYSGHHHTISSAFTAPNDWVTTAESNATHKHTINYVAAAEATQRHNNMPPYYVLAFIMKL